MPTAFGLMWQAGDQIEAEIAESSGAQKFCRLENICAAMHSPGGSQFRLVKGLHAHADTVESRFAPRGCFFGRNCFGIGFERHFLECVRESRANRGDDFREAFRFKKAGSSAAEINGVDGRIQDIRYSIFLEEAGKFGDLAANRADIRRV